MPRMKPRALSLSLTLARPLLLYSSLTFKGNLREGVKNGYFTVRLNVRGGGVSHNGPDRKQMWKCWPIFSIEFWFFDTQNTFYLIVGSWGASKMHYSYPADCKGVGVNPYGQPDRKKFRFFTTPLKLFIKYGKRQKHLHIGHYLCSLFSHFMRFFPPSVTFGLHLFPLARLPAQF